MRIISKFTDYYDWISHKLGADPNIVYIRAPLKESMILDYKEAGYAWLRPPEARNPDSYEEGKWVSETLVAGKHVFQILAHEKLGRVHRQIMDPVKHKALLKANYLNKIEMPAPAKEKGVYEFIQKVGVPVFMVRRHYKGWEVMQNIPILNDIGIPSRIPAQQMWQEIFHVLSNVLRKSPDKEPPAKIGNDDRVEAAGFDLKTSFRHPVKWRKERK